MKYWVRSKDERFHYIPTDTVYIPIDKEAVMRSGMFIPYEYRDSMPQYMAISLKGRQVLARGDLMLLEMLAEANWERPLYMSRTVGDDNYISSLSDFFITEGLAHRITPFNWKELGYSNDYDIIIDSEKMYDNVMKRFKFGGLAENPDYYIDETIQRMVYTHRVLLASLAERLIEEGKKEKALEVLDYAEKVIPSSLVPHSAHLGAFSMGTSYIRLGEKSKAMDIIESTFNESKEYIEWYESLNKHHYKAISSDHYMHLGIMQTLIDTLTEGGEPYKAEIENYRAEFVKYFNNWRKRNNS